MKTAEYKYKQSIVRLMQHLYIRTDHSSRRTTQASSSKQTKQTNYVHLFLLLAHVCTDELSMNYLSFAQVRPDRSSVSSINRANDDGSYDGSDHILSISGHLSITCSEVTNVRIYVLIVRTLGRVLYEVISQVQE